LTGPNGHYKSEIFTGGQPKSTKIWETIDR
jgi:hypothetical protein